MKHAPHCSNASQHAPAEPRAKAGRKSAQPPGGPGAARPAGLWICGRCACAHRHGPWTTLAASPTARAFAHIPTAFDQGRRTPKTGPQYTGLVYNGSTLRPSRGQVSPGSYLVWKRLFLALLLRIDHDLAAQTCADGCPCGGVLHRADYPRKPRGCPVEVRHDHSSRLSFCCSMCRRRATSMSVRFLGRRVYLALAVVLVSARPAGPTPAAARLGLSWALHGARWRAGGSGGVSSSR